MKTHRVFSFALTAALAVSCFGAASARTWTESNSGRTLEGDYVKLDGDNVVIRRTNGTNVNILLERLSDADREFVKSQPPASAASEVAAPGSADNEITLSGVHLCCGGCEKGIDAAIGELEGVEYTVSRPDKTIAIKGSKPGDVQAALNAIAKAGYYGESTSATLKIESAEPSSKKTDSVEISGVHLCCGSCVKAVDRVVSAVEGAAAHTAEKNADTFTVTGEGFSAAEIIAALHAEGIHGNVQ